MIISIDETGFGFKKSKDRAWINKNYSHDYYRIVKKLTEEYTLLLAISLEKIIGYYLVRGSVNEFVFLDFLISLNTEFETLKIPSSNVVLVLDNCQIHKTNIVSNYLKSVQLQTIFFPKYSPQINHIENLFNRIKFQYKKKTFLARKEEN